MEKKYEFTEETIKIAGVATLHRIKALCDFGYVKAGDFGGFIEKEENLSHNGDAWVCGNARICDDARVYGNAWVCSDAMIAKNADYICFKGFGSVYRSTTVFRCRDNHIHVKCGCFSGTLAEFVEKVKETHGDSKYAREYLACIEAVKIHFEE